MTAGSITLPNSLTPYYHGSGMTLTYERQLIPRGIADRLLSDLINDVPWRQDTVTIYGRTHLLPRLQQWYGDPDLRYTYSGIRLVPLPWSPTVEYVRGAVEVAAGQTFNSALLNLYRDGNDTVGWHADDERELGEEPVIASVSLGAVRDFVIKHNDPRVHDSSVKIPLQHGSMLVMSGQTQTFWKHSLPRRAGVHLPRVNLTFRNIGDRP